MRDVVNKFSINLDQKLVDFYLYKNDSYLEKSGQWIIFTVLFYLLNYLSVNSFE